MTLTQTPQVDSDRLDQFLGRFVNDLGATIAADLGHCGRLRCGLDRRSAVVKAGSDTNTKTDTNQSGADDVKRAAQHRQ